MANDHTNSDQHADHDSQRLLTEFPYPSYERWRAEVEKQLRGASFDHKMTTETYEGIKLRPIYNAKDVSKLPQMGSLPGFAPYVRHTDPAGRSVYPWLIAQDTPCSTPEQVSAALRFDLERGQNAVNLTLDRAGCLGKDADQASADEIGSGGVSLSSVSDFKILLSGIDWAHTPFYIYGGCSALAVAALFAAQGRTVGQELAERHGCVGADPLSQLAADGALPVSLQQSYDEMAALTGWAVIRAPKLCTISARDYIYHEAGGSAVEELACALAAAVEYLRAMEDRQIGIDDAASHIHFSFTAEPHFFTSISKLRAARMLWADIVTAAGGSPVAQKMSMHVRTSPFTATYFDPYVNMLRAAGQAFAGVVGGCDSLEVGLFDQAVRPPEEFSRRIARNTQLILQHESHLYHVIDPAGGSWFVETLTDQIAREAWKLFQTIEIHGGLYTAFQSGEVQDRIAGVADKRADALARRKETLIGTNKYPNMDEKPLDVHRTDWAAIREERIENAQRAKDGPNHTAALSALERLPRFEPVSAESFVEELIRIAQDGATLGEMAEALWRNDSGGVSVKALVRHRAAEPFEKIRKASESHRQKHGIGPQVYVAAVGMHAKLKPRVDFAVEFFQIGGFDVVSDKGHGSAEVAAKAGVESGRPVIVLCGSDEAYPDLVPLFVRSVRTTTPHATVVLAGNPGERAEEFRKAGVDEFIHLGSDVREILSRVLGKLGVML